MVVTSTSEVYGTAQKVPIDEFHPLVGQSPYSATKIGSDQLAISFFRSFQSPVLVVRPFNTYGPRQSERAVIPTILEQVQRGQSEISLGSTNPTRDFVYVKDTVQGFICAFQHGSPGEVYNLATGFEISISDLVDLVAEVTGKSLSIAGSKERSRPKASEVERLCGDFQKAYRELKWTPKKSGREGLIAGVKSYLEWCGNRHVDALANKATRYQI